VRQPRDFAVVSRELRQVRYRGVNGSYFLDNVEQSGLGFPDTTRDAGEHHSGNRASRRLLIKGISPGNNFVPEFAGFRLSWAQRELSR
jgi:hypothetical protein